MALLEKEVSGYLLFLNSLDTVQAVRLAAFHNLLFLVGFYSNKCDLIQKAISHALRYRPLFESFLYASSLLQKTCVSTCFQ